MLLLTETWATNNPRPPNIPDHTCIHAPGRKGPTGRASGGIYVSDNIAHHVKQCTDHCTSERLWLKISAHIGTPKDTYIGVCYFPPKGSTSYHSTSTEGGQVRDPFAPLEKDLEYFHARGNVLLAGDFNARTSILPDIHEDGALSNHIPSTHLEHYTLPHDAPQTLANLTLLERHKKI
jgi:hypothetical protein